VSNLVVGVDLELGERILSVTGLFMVRVLAKAYPRSIKISSSNSDSSSSSSSHDPISEPFS